MEFVPHHGGYLRLVGTTPDALIRDLLGGLGPDDRARLNEGLVLERAGTPGFTLDTVLSLREGLTEVLVEAPPPDFLAEAAPAVWRHVWHGDEARRTLVHHGRLRYDERCDAHGRWTVRWDDAEVQAAQLTPEVRRFIAEALAGLRAENQEAAVVLEGVSDRATADEAKLREAAIRFDAPDDDDIPF
jgi:hypothetical protein